MIGRKYTPLETAALREAHLREGVLPAVSRIFADVPDLMSACLLVAQYWNDEADDAVNYALIFSERAEPDLAACARNIDFGKPDDVNLSGAIDHSDLLSEEIEWVTWDHNGATIPMYAAFCKEGCDQSTPWLEAYAPYAHFRRTGEGVDVEVVGRMIRPWLDGVRPSWESP